MNEIGRQAIERRIEKIQDAVREEKRNLNVNAKTRDMTRQWEEEINSLTMELRRRNAVARQSTLRPSTQGRLNSTHCYNCRKLFFGKDHQRTLCTVCGFAHCQDCARFREHIFALAYDEVLRPVCCRCIHAVRKQSRALEALVSLLNDFFMMFDPKEVGPKARELAKLEMMESQILTKNQPDLSRMHKRLLDKYEMDLLGFYFVTHSLSSRCKDGTGLAKTKGYLCELNDDMAYFGTHKTAFRNLLMPRKRSGPPRNRDLHLASDKDVQHVWNSFKNLDTSNSMFADDCTERQLNDNMLEEFRCNLNSVAKVASYVLKYHFRFRELPKEYL